MELLQLQRLVYQLMLTLQRSSRTKFRKFYMISMHYRSISNESPLEVIETYADNKKATLEYTEHLHGVIYDYQVSSPS